MLVHSDLSEQIKEVTKDSHVRAENTQLMLNYQKGQITLPQYKVKILSKTYNFLICFLYNHLKVWTQSLRTFYKFARIIESHFSKCPQLIFLFLSQ